MPIRRTATDVLSVLSLLLVLTVLVWLFELIDVPLARWFAGSTGSTREAAQQGWERASQILGLTYIGIVLLAGFVGGKFLRGRPLKIRVAYFLAALAFIGFLCIAGKASGVIVPTIMSGRGWLIFPMFLLFLTTGWGYGTGSVGEVSDSASSAGSAGAGAGATGVEAYKHRDDISDFFS